MGDGAAGTARGAGDLDADVLGGATEAAGGEDGR